MFTNKQNMGSPQQTWVEKTTYDEKTPWLSSKKIVPDAKAS